jgi:mannose-6-phosphate isomerase-like protein (cupin superfamily)
MTASRQELPLAGSKSNFRFNPESRLNSEIAARPKSAKRRNHVSHNGRETAGDRWRTILLINRSRIPFNVWAYALLTGQIMNQSGKILASSLVLIATVFTGATASLAEDQPAPQIKSVPLDPGDKSYFLLLRGPPETKSFRSGLVTLAPGKSIGVHNSGVNEEMIVPLEGEGELRFSNHSPLVIKSGLITYAPAHTEHDVINTGAGILRYIFITAKAE